MSGHAIAPFAVSTRLGRHGVSIIEAAGELDFNTADLLRKALAESLAKGRSRIVLDLGDLEFMDSTGVGVLVRGLKACLHADGTLVLSRLGAGPRDVLRKVGLLHRFTVTASVEATEDALGLGPVEAALEGLELQGKQPGGQHFQTTDPKVET